MGWAEEEFYDQDFRVIIFNKTSGKNQTYENETCYAEIEGVKACMTTRTATLGPSDIPLIAFGLSSILMTGWGLFILFGKNIDAIQELQATVSVPLIPPISFSFDNFKEIGFTVAIILSSFFPVLAFTWVAMGISGSNPENWPVT
jgi:hypothetical protein